MENFKNSDENNYTPHGISVRQNLFLGIKLMITFVVFSQMIFSPITASWRTWTTSK